MPIRVYYEVLNQKGTPALYSDNYAQRPAAGYTGRIFCSPDTGQIFYDTGTTWTLLADAGVGGGSLASVCANGNTTATGIVITANGLSTNSLTSTNLTAGSIPFIGTGGLFSQDNSNLFWDNTNKYLGINTNTPTAPFDIHTTANVGMQINNTTTADSKIAFLQAGAGKWRIGNLYSGGTNLFHIYNNTAISLAMQIDSTNAALFYGSLSSNSFIQAASGITLTNGGTTTTAGATNIGGLTSGLSIALASGFNQTLTFPTGVAYTYTFPNATGTLALTSNLSNYLPLAGGTLTGQLVVSNASTPQLQVTHSGTGTATIYVSGTSGYSTILWTGGAGGGYGQMSYNLSGNYMQYGTAGSEFMRMYSNGNLRLFTSSSTDNGAKFQVEGTATISTSLCVNTTSTDLIAQFNYNSSTAYTTSSRGNVLRVYNPNGGANIYAGIEFGGAGTGNDGLAGINGVVTGSGAGTLTFYTRSGGTFAEKMRLTNNGILNYNIASETDVADLYHPGISLSNANGGTLYIANNTTSNTTIVRFSNPNGAIGSISTSGSTTAYNTSSDYRLKQDLKDYDGLDLVLKIKTYDFEYKSDNSRMFGVIAHELKNIVPYVVFGEKDGEEMQGVDYSKLVPITIKAIQQLDQRLTALENLN